MQRVVAVAACTLLWLIASVQRAGASDLQAAVAVAEITPPLGYRMSGYFFERLNTGTHDPLQAKAVVFRQGERQAALVFCDLIGISPAVSKRARQLASEKTGMPFENVLIAATHSHTGPLYFGTLHKHFHEQTVARTGKDPHESLDYSDMLVKKLVEVIAAAHQAAQPVDLKAGVATPTGLAFNRRYHMKNGTVQFNPGKLNPEIIRPAGPIDPEAGLLLLRDRRTERDLALLTVFALHLDTVGGSEYSADYPFYLEQDLKKTLGRKFVSIFGLGTCGDINHIDVTHDRAQKGHEEAARIGAALAQSVGEVLARTKPIAAPALAMRSTIVNVPLQRYGPEEVAEAQRDLAKIGGRELSFLDQVKTCKIVSLQHRSGDTLPMEVQVLRLSDEIALVGLPGEVFVDLGLAIKRASPFAQTMVIELANDAPAYIPTKKAFAEGSYETVNSLIEPGGGELLVAAAVELLKEMKPGK